MKARQKVVLTVSFVLAAGMASGTLLQDFGSAKGVAEIGGPTFYAANDSQLLINRPPNSTQQKLYYVQDSDLEFTSDMNLQRIEKPVNATFSINAKLYDSQSPDSTLKTNLVYFNSSGRQTLCDTNRTVTVKYNATKTYTESCIGNITGDVQEFRWFIESDGYTELFLEAYGDTRIEVEAQ